MFTWTATFDDGHTINMFDDAIEHKFSEVESYPSTITKFKIMDTKEEYYEVDVKKGTIDCNKCFLDETMKGELGLSLVYKRRNEVRIDSLGNMLDSRVTHIVGLRQGDWVNTVEIFPGLGMAPRKISIKEKDSSGDLIKDDNKTSIIIEGKVK
jgi:hypothetical protein